jgi:hypothetical protein
MDVIRDAFTQARDYQKAWADYKAGPKDGIKPELPRPRSHPQSRWWKIPGREAARALALLPRR